VTDIRFHFGVEERTLYTCRLLRKATRQGSKVLVRGEDTEIDLLDKALWTFEPQEFLPHHRLRAGHQLSSRLHRTPVWLMGEEDDWPDGLPRPRVLVHLGQQPADDADSWERMIELVTVDPEDRRQARQRWRAYEARGWAPQALNVGEAS
jgi:DNA polymerase-3 subunit chi